MVKKQIKKYQTKSVSCAILKKAFKSIITVDA